MIAWTAEVFALELWEPGCAWNGKIGRLRDYVARHGGIPEHAKKTTVNKEERSLVAFVTRMRNRVRKGQGPMACHPYCLKASEACGMRWDLENDPHFEAIFAN